LLTGPRDFIAEARRVRKVMGGGMRQAGFLAAAGLYALQHHVNRLGEDHEHARMLAETLSNQPYTANIRPVETNIVIFDLTPPWTPATFIARLAEMGVKVSGFGPQTIRMVTHLDVSREMVAQVQQKLNQLERH
jgi:threonine aldolase